MEFDFNEIFDIDDGAGNGEEERSFAENAESAEEDSPELDGDGEDAGAEEREDAEPADGEEEGGGTDKGGSSSGRRRDEDARYAAARRRAERERDLAIDRYREQTNKDFDTLVSALGIRSEDGKRVTNRAELEAYAKERSEKERAARLRRAGAAGEVLEEMIEDHPAIRAAREAAEALSEERSRAEETQRIEHFREEMREISKLDPTVRSAADLRAKEYFGELYDRVKRGYTLVDAFRLATYGDTVERAAKNARRQAAASAQSREHMRTTASARGSVLGAVPPEVLEQYRLLNPTATDAEIARDWNRYKKAER